MLSISERLAHLEDFVSRLAERISKLETQKRGTGNGMKIPTIEDVQQYVREKGLNVDAETFWHYYESQGWVKANGRPVKRWRSAVHNFKMPATEQQTAHNRFNTQVEEMTKRQRQSNAAKSRAEATKSRFACMNPDGIAGDILKRVD